MTDPGIYDKLARYCAYSERSTKDVKTKMYSLKVDKALYDEYLDKLKQENYLHEERYAKAFVNGHIRKKWGKTKIKHALQQDGISTQVIEKYLEGISEEDYSDTLIKLADKKMNSVKTGSLSERKAKTFRFLLGKGYDAAAIKKVLQNIT